MKCPRCGKDNPEGEEWCECGFPLKQQANVPQPQPSPIEPQNVPQPQPSPIEPQNVPQPQPSPIVAKLVLPDSTEIILGENEKIVGRQDVARLLSPEEAKYVSRQHFRVWREGNEFYIEDGIPGKPSANGTLLNGEEIRETGKRLLNNGDEITIEGPTNVVKIIFKSD